MNPTSQNHSGALPSNFAALPAELYRPIFQHIRPIYERSPERLGLPDDKRYFQDLKAFRDLRLVSSAWDSVVKPLAWEELVLDFSRHKLIASITVMFQLAKPFVRTVVMISTWRDIGMDAVWEALAGLLMLCRKLRALECYGLRRVFTSEDWIRQAPGLCFTVRSLTMNVYIDDDALSHALAALGISLERLEILSGAGKENAFRWQSLKLPTVLPRLSELVIRRGEPTLKQLCDFFSRIKVSGWTTGVRKKDVDMRPPSPLRSLCLDFLRGMRAADFACLLRTNDIGMGLTSLRIEVFEEEGEQRSLPCVSQILQVCPNLTTFAYLGFVQPEVFEQMPPGLEHLEIGVYIEYEPGYDIDVVSDARGFVRWIREGGAPKLRTLKLVKRPVYVLDGIDGKEELEEVCREWRILLTVDDDWRIGMPL